MKKMLEKLLNESPENIKILLKPYTKNKISYSELEDFIITFNQLELTNSDHFEKIKSLINKRLIEHPEEIKEIENLWEKIPQLKAHQNIDFLKLIDMNKPKAISLMSENLTKYYLLNEKNLNNIYQEKLLEQQKPSHNQLLIKSFLEFPSLEKKEFLQTNGFSLEKICTIALKIPIKNLHYLKAFDTILNFFEEEIKKHQPKKNDDTTIQFISNLCLYKIIHNDIWDKKGNIFPNKIHRNKNQILYGNGSGHGDDFNFMFSPQTFFSNIKKDPYENIFFIPFLSLCGASIKQIETILSVSKESSDNILTTYLEFLEQKVTTDIQEKSFNIFKSQALDFLLNNHITQSKKNIKIKV